jgi:probable HAF family extracellular repeat protein
MAASPSDKISGEDQRRNKMVVSETVQPVVSQNAKREIFGPNSLLRLHRDLAAAKSTAVRARVTAAVASPRTATSKAYSFVTVDYPGAAATEVLDSNGTTDVGIFIFDPSVASVNQSFTHTGDEYQIVNLPDSLQSVVFAINTLGVMAGAYSDLSSNLHGFVSNAGVISNVDFPGSIQTMVVGINDNGDTAGIWVDAASKTHGFVNVGGVFTSIDHPAGTSTEVTKINASGEVAGYYEDAASVSHGFLWSNGNFTSIDFPGATSTIPFGINDSGEIAGYYLDASSVSHGFLYQNNFSIVDVAGAKGTLLTRISNEGDLTGVFVDALNEDHGLTAH